MPHYLMQLYCITIFKDKSGCYMASSVHNDNRVIMEKDYVDKMKGGSGSCINVHGEGQRRKMIKSLE